MAEWRATGKEWDEIKKKSTGSYTTNGEANEPENEDRAKLEDELDDEKMRKQQEKAERNRRKSEREDRKFAKEHPESDFAKQYNKTHQKSDKKQPKIRIGKPIRDSVVKKQPAIGYETTVPKYKSPDFTIAKVGYTPISYRPVSPYCQSRAYRPIFGGKVTMPKANRAKRASKRRISPITGFTYF